MFLYQFLIRSLLFFYLYLIIKYFLDNKLIFLYLQIRIETYYFDKSKLFDLFMFIYGRFFKRL